MESEPSHYFFLGWVKFTRGWDKIYRARTSTFFKTFVPQVKIKIVHVWMNEGQHRKFILLDQSIKITKYLKFFSSCWIPKSKFQYSVRLFVFSALISCQFSTKNWQFVSHPLLAGHARDSFPTAAIKKRRSVRTWTLLSVAVPVGIPPTDMAGLDQLFILVL